MTARKEDPIYTEREKAALAWCEELTNVYVAGVSDSVYEKV